jgi:hypothetical protein
VYTRAKGLENSKGASGRQAAVPMDRWNVIHLPMRLARVAQCGQDFSESLAELAEPPVAQRAQPSIDNRAGSGSDV